MIFTSDSDSKGIPYGLSFLRCLSCLYCESVAMFRNLMFLHQNAYEHEHQPEFSWHARLILGTTRTILSRLTAHGARRQRCTQRKRKPHHRHLPLDDSQLRTCTSRPHTLANMAPTATTQMVQCFGKKKTATAVAHCKQGKGLIKVNGRPLNLVQPEILRFKVYEPVLILGLDKFCTWRRLQSNIKYAWSRTNE